MANIGIIEDDKVLNKGIAFALKKNNHNAICGFSISDAENILSSSKIDLLLLDINLPDGNGTDICNKVKEKYNIPVVFLTANDTEADMLNGYKLGCEDYIAKPFSIKVLVHKIDVILKRSNNNEDYFKYKDMKIDYQKMKVYINDIEVKLTATEYKIIDLLSKNKGKVLTKQILLDKLWDINGNFVDENTLSVNIRRIRKKIEKDPKNPEYIITVFGVGYILG